MPCARSPQEGSATVALRWKTYRWAMARTGSRNWASGVIALTAVLLLGCGTLDGNDFLNEQEEKRELSAGDAVLDRLLLPLSLSA